MFTELLSQCIQEAGVEYAHLEPPCPEEEIAQAEAAVGYPFPTRAEGPAAGDKRRPLVAVVCKRDHGECPAASGFLDGATP